MYGRDSDEWDGEPQWWCDERGDRSDHTHNGDTAVTCTATEQSLPSVTGYTWGDASYSGNGPTITKGDAASAPVVEVTNTISKDQGYLKISKVFSDPAYSGTFAIDYLCTDATPTSGTVNLNGGATSAAIGPIDTHNGDTAVTCTATEQSLPSVTGYTWGDASYSGNGPTITKGDAASAPVVEVTNIISRDLGSLKITKSAAPYSCRMSSVKRSTSPRLADGGTVTEYPLSIEYPSIVSIVQIGIPTGSICTVVEQTPEPLPGLRWAAPTYTPAGGVTTITTKGAVHEVQVVNALVPPILVTDSSLCTFDTDAGTDGRQWRRLMTQDVQAMPHFKFGATNPGQFFYNLGVTGDPGTW